MLPRDLDVILRYLEARALRPESLHEKAVTLYMAAYLTVRWHLWARTDETSSLRVQDYRPKHWFNGGQENTTAAPSVRPIRTTAVRQNSILVANIWIRF